MTNMNTVQLTTKYRDYICKTYFFATGNETTWVLSSINGLRTRLAEWHVATGEQVTKYKLLAEMAWSNQY